MKTLSDNLIKAKNRLHQASPWLILLDITLPDAAVIRLVNNSEDITYGGNVYRKFAFNLSVVEQDAGGAIPQVKLQVANVTRLLTEHLNAQDGGLGGTVTITVVNSGHLAENYSQLELGFTVMGCEANEQYVTWTLGMANPRNQRFPLYRFLPHCSWASNFKGAECGYAGAGTACDGKYDTCLGYANTGRFGGFLGMAADGIRIA